MIERSHPFPRPFHPSPDAVDELIQRASARPDGLEFLDRGALDAVAAAFGVHAFTVEEARQVRRGASS
ncbi:MAG: hypothetical protein KDC38_17310 [Planctomycetes bacterium]|nr:hypothetical protein [Planctomycetota bacterium]